MNENKKMNEYNDTNKFAEILLRDYLKSDFINENEIDKIESYELIGNYVSQIHKHVMNDNIFVNASIEHDLYNNDENFIFIEFRLCNCDELDTTLRFNVDDDDIKFMLNHKCVSKQYIGLNEYDNNIDALLIDQKMMIDDNNNKNKNTN